MTVLENKYGLLKLVIETDDNEIIKQIDDHLLDVILDSIPPGPELPIELIEKAFDDSKEHEFTSHEEFQKRFGIDPNRKKPSPLEIKEKLLKHIIEIDDENVICQVHDFSQRLKNNTTPEPPAKSVEEINRLIEIADNEKGTSHEEFKKHYNL